MAGNSRAAEDQLTSALAAVFSEHDGLDTFWKTFTPQRLHARLPDSISTFEHFGGPKPDILFRCQGKPVFYVEAKLGSGTEPMQLTRARSKMRASGAKDDQILLVTQSVDIVPAAVGWVGTTLPCPTVTWHKVFEAFEANKTGWKAPAIAALDAFRTTLSRLSTGVRNRRKRLMLGSGHPYGAVMQAVTRRLQGVRAEFVYGGNIAPRVNFGLKSWSTVLGSKDVERVSVQCGLDKDGKDSYRTAVCLWHASDLIGSREPIEENWQCWRAAIGADPSLKLHYGGRKEHEREYAKVLPPMCPRVKVGVIRRPGSGIYVEDLRHRPFDEIVEEIFNLIVPYLEMIQRAQHALERTGF